MQALAHSHMSVNRLSGREMLRVAYQWRFHKDITDLALANDTKQFMESGNAPDYLVKYLIFCYGVH